MPAVSIDNTEYVKSLKEELRTLREQKLINNNELDTLKTKNELYENELRELRELVYSHKEKLSSTNKESYKLDITNLQNTLQNKNKEIDFLSRENSNLKGRLIEVQSRVENIVYESQQFRSESIKQV